MKNVYYKILKIHQNIIYIKCILGAFMTATNLMHIFTFMYLLYFIEDSTHPSCNYLFKILSSFILYIRYVLGCIILRIQQKPNSLMNIYIYILYHINEVPEYNNSLFIWCILLKQFELSALLAYPIF